MLVAFFLAALAKFVSIILGYLGDSLLRILLSIMDDAAIRAYRKTLIARKGVPAIVRFWLSIKGLFYRCARRDPPHLQPALTRERRVEVITRFLLGFSDQKIVTGVAILRAALVNRSRLTFYELRVVFSLAWFSATTHIATL